MNSKRINCSNAAVNEGLRSKTKHSKQPVVRKDYFLFGGEIFASPEPHFVTTVLGSCISLCLWDPALKIGGINHYQLPLWHGKGLASPKYGNIAIKKLIQKMINLGSLKKNLIAKVFGGANVLQPKKGGYQVGQRNIILVREILDEEKIPILAEDTGGHTGRKLMFCTESGVVKLKKMNK